ncbi:recombinase family protein [Streptomyces sp. AV19]|uniref:recombinase family protein n=1 Tax=Streptomyces sp. AV19 TaxID=2793068 RepID=UPI0018FE09F2|nr:recombinase family protein [Streptomyces sp. AV19]MBH1934882.1 recombinase family protein [Streptomyces sp. AV19]MDG4537016.1 recombinase family protein [Streptomyces sp. AV19]
MTPPLLGKSIRNLDLVRAFTYGRQSKAREDESRTSPEGQRQATRALVDSRGWTFVEHFEDVGRSGFDPKIVRPGFEALMAAVRREECDVVIIPALSRLTRQGAYEAMKINDELQRHGVSLVSVDEPFLDTSTPVGVAIFALIAGLAQQESESKRQHILRAQAAVRLVGGHVTGSAPYGFKSERTTVPVQDGDGTLTITRLVPDLIQAQHVRGMVADAMAGKSAVAIAKRLNEEKVPTSLESMGETGRNRLKGRRKRADIVSAPLEDERAQWHSGSVLRVLRDPRLAGFASKVVGGGGKREPQRDASGEIVRSHEGIIPPGEWFQLQEVVNRKRPEVKQTKRPSLLTGWGVLFCAVCGSTMQHSETKGIRYYRCKRPAGTIDGHKSLSVNMQTVDNVVAGRVFARLSVMTDDFEAQSAEDQELIVEASRRFAHQQDTSGVEAERAELTAALEYTRESLATLYKDRAEGAYRTTTGRRMFMESEERLAKEEERLEGALTLLAERATSTVVLPIGQWCGDNDGDPIGEGSPWTAWDLARRREFLALFIDRVELGKATAHGRASDTEKRVSITWAQPAKQEDAQESA